MMQRPTFYNYIYLDPRKPGRYTYSTISFLFEPFYVGKGKNNRYKEHLLNIRKDHMITLNALFYNKLKKITSERVPYIVKINFTDSEVDAYTEEVRLITEIGSSNISEINDGPLTNICLYAAPPNHKGKTYEEIYGVERGRAIKRKRSLLQKQRGGYGPSKHTEDTKKKISRSVSEAHASRDCSLPESAKRKISQKAKERLATHNPHNKEWTIVSPSGLETVVKTGLKRWCCDNNLSISTLQSYWASTPGKVPKSGKNKGWYIKSCKILIC